LKGGNKSDRIDAGQLAELLRTNQLKPAYHGEHGVRTLKELGRSYLTPTKDVTRMMNRIKALYRSWANPCIGATVYAPRHRGERLAQIAEPGVPVQAERLYKSTGAVKTGASEDATRATGGNQREKGLEDYTFLTAGILRVKSAVLVDLHPQDCEGF